MVTAAYVVGETDASSPISESTWTQTATPADSSDPCVLKELGHIINGKNQKIPFLVFK